MSVGDFPFLRIKSKKKCNNIQDEKDSSSASLIFVSLVLSAIRFVTCQRKHASVLSVACGRAFDSHADLCQSARG
jgi:hypothetical protein